MQQVGIKCVWGTKDYKQNWVYRSFLAIYGDIHLLLSALAMILRGQRLLRTLPPKWGLEHKENQNSASYGDLKYLPGMS